MKAYKVRSNLIRPMQQCLNTISFEMKRYKTKKTETLT